MESLWVAAAAFLTAAPDGSLPPAPGLEFRICEGLQDSPHWLQAELVNFSGRPLVAAAILMCDERGRTFKALRTDWEAWTPARGWSAADDVPLFPCGNGKTTIDVPPGATIRVLLGRPEPGLLRFNLDYRPDGKNRRRRTAVSPPVRVAERPPRR